MTGRWKALTVSADGQIVLLFHILDSRDAIKEEQNCRPTEWVIDPAENAFTFFYSLFNEFNELPYQVERLRQRGPHCIRDYSVLIQLGAYVCMQH